MTPWRWLNRSRSDHAQRRLRPGRRQQDIRGPGAASESASFRTSLIASILRSWPVGPIVNLADKVRSRLVSEEFGDIHGVLVGQHIPMTPQALGLNAHRHVLFDERGRFIGRSEEVMEGK